MSVRTKALVGSTVTHSSRDTLGKGESFVPLALGSGVALETLFATLAQETAKVRGNS